MDGHIPERLGSRTLRNAPDVMRQFSKMSSLTSRETSPNFSRKSTSRRDRQLLLLVGSIAWTLGLRTKRAACSACAGSRSRRGSSVTTPRARSCSAQLSRDSTPFLRHSGRTRQRTWSCAWRCAARVRRGQADRTARGRRLVCTVCDPFTT